MAGWTLTVLVLVACMPSEVEPVHCFNTNDRSGAATHEYSCGLPGFYISGLIVRPSGSILEDLLNGLVDFNCCERQNQYEGETELVVYQNWTAYKNIIGSVGCPSGYLLQGLYVERSSESAAMSDIKYARCAKPANHGEFSSDNCDTFYTSEDPAPGHHFCAYDFYVQSINIGSDSLETMMCCQMAQPTALGVTAEAGFKKLIMDRTLIPLARLANDLGYAWCSGCMSATPGEDFRVNNDGWYADQSTRCSGHKHNERLRIIYRDWKLVFKKMEYGYRTTETIQEQHEKHGAIVNTYNVNARAEILQHVDSVRTVIHTVSSPWSQSQAFGESFLYYPQVGRVPYKFGYVTSNTTDDSTDEPQVRSFIFSSSKIMPPRKACDFTMEVKKIRTTLPYTATVGITFSVEFQGFLRSDGGYNGTTINAHHTLRESADSPTFNYKFGDASLPFWLALKRQAEADLQPWMWSFAKDRNSRINGAINHLTDETLYQIQLKGKFEEVIGKHAELIVNPFRSAQDNENSNDGVVFPLTTLSPLGGPHLCGDH